MRIYLADDGLREAYLAKLARERGHEVTQTGEGDVAVLGLPRSALPPEEKRNWRQGQIILCGQAEPSLEAEARARRWTLWRVLEDEVYVQKNAELSAEGGIYAAMGAADFALQNAACLVIGYGRIGKALTQRLRALGAQVIVAARRRESREAAGEGSVDLPDIPAILPQMKVVFNTVPSPVLRKEELTMARPDTLLIDLASAPYGIDLETAQGIGLRAWREGGIPGRYCPQSAAQLLLDYLERRWEHV